VRLFLYPAEVLRQRHARGQVAVGHQPLDPMDGGRVATALFVLGRRCEVEAELCQLLQFALKIKIKLFYRYFLHWAYYLEHKIK
jgi:hypothetical protein